MATTVESSAASKTPAAHTAVERRLPFPREAPIPARPADGYTLRELMEYMGHSSL